MPNRPRATPARDDSLTALLGSVISAWQIARRRADVLWWHVTVEAIQFVSKGDAMVTVPLRYKVQMLIDPRDAGGNPARVDGVPVWSLSDADHGVVTTAADGLSAEFVPDGTLGTVQVMVKADADLGTGVRELTGLLDIAIEAGEAVTLAVNASVVPA